MKTGLFASCLGLSVAWCGSLLAAEPAEAKPVQAKAEAAPDAKPTEATPVEAKTKAHETKPSAAAGPIDEPEERAGTEHADEPFGHGMQFGLRAGLAGGYRMIFRYDKSPFCHAKEPGKLDKDQQKFCGNTAPLALDVALSFAVVDFAEPYVWARFGLAGEASTNTEPLLAFGVGARIYTMSDSKLKIFVEPALGMEVEAGSGSTDWDFDGGVKADYKKDFLIHLGFGPQYDFARAVGVYVGAGLTTGVLRYIHTELEIGGGVQVRVP